MLQGNLGNAKTDGMEDDLHFKTNQYSLILSIFFIPYVIFAVPFAFLGKKYGPSKVLPILMFTFGSMTLLGAAVQNFGGMMAIRWILGESDMKSSIFTRLTAFHRNVRVGLLPAGHLLLDHLLPQRRACPPPGHLLRRIQHCQRFLRSACFWRLP